MKIAIIGSGISGLTCAHLLHIEHNITIYEANDYIGGHTHTIDVTSKDGHYNVDTGFIVYNEETYPNFCKLLEKINVPSQPTSMTFSVRCDKTGIEYGSDSLNTFFAQRKNILSLPYWKMFFEIFKLRRNLDTYLTSEQGDMSLGVFLSSHGFSQRFINHFVIPLGASLWSAEPGKIMDFPARTFGNFFKNHGFLQPTNPIQWRVIRGGSKQYVTKLVEPFAEHIKLNSPVAKVERNDQHVVLHCQDQSVRQFDQVILATHSDQALQLLDDPTEDEQRILSAIPYQENSTVLHTDDSVLPRNKTAWSSWNYLLEKQHIDRAAVTYNMNMLQNIQASQTYCVSLNLEHAIQSEQVIGRYLYHHPVFMKQSVPAQQSHSIISGRNRTHFCGAYWGYGFHEDGVKSGLAVCKYFGKEL